MTDQDPTPGDGPGTSPAAEVFEALEITSEELRVTAEQLRSANEALRASRAEVEQERSRYLDLFESAPDAYLVTDLNGQIRDANAAAAALLLVERRFLHGKPLIVFVPEEGRPAFRAELPRLRALIGSTEYDLRLKPRKATPIEVTARIGVVRDLWGEPLGLRWTLRDVSTRKRSEEKIRGLNAQLERRVVERSEQLESVLQINERWLIKVHTADAEARAEGRLFQDLVQEVDAILWRADAASGRYTFVSRRAEELLGHPAARWVEEPDFWLDLIHPEDRHWAEARRRKHLRAGEDHEAEYRVVASGGRVLWFRESVRVLKGDDGRPSALCGLMVSISKRKKVERQLQYARGELASQLRDMIYLRELVVRLANARGSRATLEEGLDAVASLLGAEMAAVLSREDGGGDLIVAASLGLAGTFLAPEARLGPIPGGLVEAVASGRTLLVEDFEAAPEQADHRDKARAGGFRALLAVPLFTRDGAYQGAAVGLFAAPHRPPEGQVRLLEMYAEHLADAIETARLQVQVDASSPGGGRLLAEIADELKRPIASILALVESGSPTEAALRALGEEVRRLARIADALADAAPPPGDEAAGPLRR